MWGDNIYPGAACDIPSHLYSFSFEPSHDWSRTYGKQGEIQSYVEHCARKYGVLEQVRFGAEVDGADFDESSGRWRVRVKGGEGLEARFLVAATGQLSLPADPRIPGLDSFEGEVFHSARWDHDYEMTGKRVAVVGSGEDGRRAGVSCGALGCCRCRAKQRPPWSAVSSAAWEDPLHGRGIAGLPVLRESTWGRDVLRGVWTQSPGGRAVTYPCGVGGRGA